MKGEGQVNPLRPGSGHGVEDTNRHLPLFERKYGKKGGMISAVDLLNGIARYAGMEIITGTGRYRLS